MLMLRERKIAQPWPTVTRLIIFITKLAFFNPLFAGASETATMKDECKGAAAKALLSPTAVSAARAKSPSFFLELQKYVDVHENQNLYSHLFKADPFRLPRM